MCFTPILTQILPLQIQIKNLCEINKYDILEREIPKDANCRYDYFEGMFANFRFDAIAGGIQKYTEYVVVKYIKSILKKTKHKNFVGSGGLYMNIKLNIVEKANTLFRTFGFRGVTVDDICRE